MTGKRFIPSPSILSAPGDGAFLCRIIEAKRAKGATRAEISMHTIRYLWYLIDNRQDVQARRVLSSMALVGIESVLDLLLAEPGSADE